MLILRVGALGSQRERERHNRGANARSAPECGEPTGRGTRLCEPCKHLDELTQHGVMSGLIHRGGLRALILSKGVIRVSDAVRPKT